MDTVVLIPAYNPEPAMVKTAQELNEKGFFVLIVNDGSAEEFSPLFSQAEKFARVIGYEKNCGKGAALKHGIRCILKELPWAKYFVTADADGQHSVSDIIKTAKLLRKKGGIVIGSRDFKGKIPLRSRVGNNLSRFAYTIETGRYIRDNQSGLRGFEASLCEWLLGVKGEKYDYEINVLMYAAKQNIPFCETPIETIYIEDNRSSHFDPVKDTLRLHGKMLMASLPSIIAFWAMIIIYTVIRSIRFPLPVHVAVSLAGGAGTVASIIFNGIHFYSSGTKKYSFPLNSTIISIIRTGAYATLMTVFVTLLNIPEALSLFLTVILVIPGEYMLLKLIGRRRMVK